MNPLSTATTTTTTTTTTKKIVETTKAIETTKALANQYSANCSDNGRFPVKESGCKKYYECLYQNTDFAQTIEYTCPEGTLFNVEKNLCDWEYQTVC